MKKYLFVALMAFCATAGAQISLEDVSVEGPVLVGKIQGEKANSYIPFTRGGANPIIATQDYALPRGGATITSPFNLNGITAANRFWLSMYNVGTGHRDAPKDLGASSQYIVVGGREYSVGSYRGIGFGYVSALSDVAPVFVGIQETGPDDHTNGSFIIATRASQKNEAPTVRLSVTSGGQIRGADDYMPKTAQDLANMKYVDYVIKSLQDQIDALKK